jgi:hypothetical protein
VDFRPRVAGADCPGGPLGSPGPWAPTTELRLPWACFRFVSSFVFFSKEKGFPTVF